MEAAGTDEWLGELGRDLHGPIESCCFFLMATTFCATGGKHTVTDCSLVIYAETVKARILLSMFLCTVSHNAPFWDFFIEQQ